MVAAMQEVSLYDAGINALMQEGKDKSSNDRMKKSWSNKNKEMSGARGPL
jgi:hypothetical protein